MSVGGCWVVGVDVIQRESDCVQRCNYINVGIGWGDRCRERVTWASGSCVRVCGDHNSVPRGHLVGMWETYGDVAPVCGA